MIDTISVRNFKSLREMRVELGQFTVFVGPNGSGKSSILEALDGVCRVFNQQSGKLDSQINSCQSQGVQAPVEIAVRTSGGVFRYNSRLPRAIHGRPQSALAEAADFDSSGWKPWLPKSNQSIPVNSASLLRLAPPNLKTPSFSSHDKTTMATDGTGLHAALANMALSEPDTWQLFQEDLKKIVPAISRLRHGKILGNQAPPALLFDTVGAESLHANQMSEGTLLVIGLLVALYAPNRPNLVLLDDLERGLHPKAQGDLVNLLRRLLDRNPGLQLAASTHSPYLLNCVHPKEVRMMCLRDDGSTACAPIGAHPQFEKWKDEMAPGEMWSLFGEKWLVGEGAAA